MSRLTLTPARSAFIHDFDGVHYDYDLYKPSIYAFCDVIKGETARMLLPILSEKRAPKIGHQSYKRTGDGLNYYVRIAEKLGHDPKDFAQRLSVEYHRLQRIRSMETHPHIFARCHQTNDIMDQFAGTDIRHGLLTQSCLINWAVPQLTELDRLRYFEPAAMCGFAEVGFVTKKESVEPLRTAMTKLGAKASETVFIEDNLDNIKKAKELDENILTVHVQHGRAFEPPAYVDIAVKNIAVLFEKVAAVRNIPVPAYQPRAEMALTL